MQLFNTLSNYTKYTPSIKITYQEALLEKWLEPLFEPLIMEERS